MRVTLLEHDRLLIEPVWSFLLTRRFELFDAGGARLGEIEGGSTDMELRDADGSVLGKFYRPWRLWSARIRVMDADGTLLGSVAQITVWGRVRFEIRDTDGETIGSVQPTKAPALEFDVTRSGNQMATISRQYRFFRTGSYAVDFRPQASRADRLLVLAAVVGIDKVIDGRRASSAAPVA